MASIESRFKAPPLKRSVRETFPILEKGLFLQTNDKRSKRALASDGSTRWRKVTLYRALEWFLS
jgi:hypothetical protein